MLLAPGFPAPPPGNIDHYRTYIEEKLPAESPLLFGLHPNAEIGFLTTQAETLCRTTLELQPREAAAGGGAGRQEKIEQAIESILDRLPDPIDLVELYSRVEDLTPFVALLLQEVDRMNSLLNRMKKTLTDLDNGIKGILSMTEAMEILMEALFIDKVPDVWTKIAYPSLKPLGSWVFDLVRRVQQLQEWSADLNLPKVVWISGLFNPQAFLTAVMQVTARKSEWPLDKMVLQTEVTKKTEQETKTAPREGAYISGLFMEGARWDTGSGVIRESFMKELFCEMPVIHVRALTSDRRETKDVYYCPVYSTRQRGPTFVFAANLKTKEPAAKWALAGVALLMQSE
eukprot:GILI01005410.1.p1 GENE.GILI01005410.1~~GILI01005410.1.p1  ORF type:complete len:384 (+),score=105.02 GILI01005410.1:124-1152(+)